MANPGGSHPPDLSSLQDNFSQQQVGCCCCELCLRGLIVGILWTFSGFQAKITALKELVRQSEATQGRNNASAQEKVKNIAQRLTHLKTKVSRTRGSGLGGGEG